MSVTLRKLEAKIDLVASSLVEYLESSKSASDHAKATTLIEKFGQISARPTSIDGRATAWDDERRKKFGERISQAWAAKREAKGMSDSFKRWQFHDAPPIVIGDTNALAKELGLSVKTVANKLHGSPDGLIIYGKNRAPNVYARDEDALYRLLHSAEELIQLPSKKNKSF